MKNVKLELDSDNTELAYLALRELAKRIDSDPQWQCEHTKDQVSRLRWIATYMEHKRKDSY